VRKNLENKGVKVDADAIRLTWFPVYRKHFLKKSLGRAFDCRKGYWMYQKCVEGEVNEYPIRFRQNY
jgi:optic atrophy protein 1